MEVRPAEAQTTTQKPVQADAGDAVGEAMSAARAGVASGPGSRSHARVLRGTTGRTRSMRRGRRRGASRGSGGSCCRSARSVWTFVVLVLRVGRSRGRTAARAGDAPPHERSRATNVRERSSRASSSGAVAATVVRCSSCSCTTSASAGASDCHRPRTCCRSQVVGHQWWWEVQYDDSIAQNIVSDGERDPRSRRAGRSCSSSRRAT